jgi:hypothetical protein
MSHEGFEELVAVDSAEQLCRRLLASGSGWGKSNRHSEAVELLANVHRTGELSASCVALMVCTCRRWHRVTARLIAAVQESALLDDDELDELAESFLAYAQAIAYPLAWVSTEWLEVDLEDGTSRAVTVDESALGTHRPLIEPPLRRWAAQRALRSDPSRLTELLNVAELHRPRHRDALIHGLLDAADVLKASDQRELIDRCLMTAPTGVRLAALARMCQLDGPETALRRARSDSNAIVREWQPAAPTSVPSLF